MKLKITILCLILICLFTVSSVSAEDYSFADLIELINKNNEITLDQDCKRHNDECKDGIVIDKTITIDANDHIINANHNGRIFTITKTGALTLKNAHLINGVFNGNGGAIYNEGTCTITNSNFKDNNAVVYGGAIYNSGIGLIVDGSIFTNNKAKTGGAIYNNGMALSITRSFFDNNKAFLKGGAIYNDGINLYVFESFFGDHYARDSGGAIYNDKNVYVKSSIFRGNYAGAGGAICNKGGNFKVDNSKFEVNKARVGGAIYSEGGSFEVDNSKFEVNEARDSGGAIYTVKLNYEKSYFQVYETSFKGNKVEYTLREDNGGGAIWNDGVNLMLSHSTFEYNAKGGNGDVLYNKNAVVSVISSCLVDKAVCNVNGHIKYYK